jgi:hypothetical protein
MTGRHHEPTTLRLTPAWLVDAYATALARAAQQVYRTDRKHVRQRRRDRLVYAAPYVRAAAVAAGIAAVVFGGLVV